MDVAYNQHSDRSRRKNRSSTNLNHLTLAPLTVKLPLDADDEVVFPESTAPAVQPYISYLQGKSAPTTPRLLSRSPVDARSRSPARSHHRRTPSAPSGPLPKSKSSTHLGSNARTPGSATPRRRKDDTLSPRDRNDSDWLLRAGAVMTSEAREFKGQAWLVSRQSSTSLAGNPEDEFFEQELARERELASRRTSRRGSAALADDELSSPRASRLQSRSNSRSHSLAGIRSQLLTPLDRPGEDSYFGSPTEVIDGPDFVNLDEKLEELERDTSQDDEAAVRRLMRREQNGKGTWVGGVIGWSLFSVEENDEDSSSDDGEGDSQEDTSSRSGRGAWTPRHFEGVASTEEEKIPPPAADEGKWKDAAWLLSVAAKVMF